MNSFARADAIAAADTEVLVDEQRLRPHDDFFPDQIGEDVSGARSGVGHQGSDAILFELPARNLAQCWISGEELFE